MALKDLYKYAKQQEEAGKAPAGAKSSLEILVDAREKGIKGARSVGGVTTSDLKRQISAAKTTAVLQKALDGTTDPAAKDNLSNAIRMVATDLNQKRKGSSDMQKKKEEEQAAKTPAGSTPTRKELAEKRLADLDKLANSETVTEAGKERFENQRKNLQTEVEKMAAEQIWQQDISDIDAMNQEDRKALEQYAVNRVRDQNLPLEMAGMMPTAEQEAAGFIGKFGKQRADELAETFMRQENEVLAKQAEEAGRNFADKSPVLASAATVPVNLLSGIVGTVGQLQGAARATGRYGSLDANETGTALDKFSGAVRGQVAQNIEGDEYDENGNLVKDGGALRKLGALAYQGGMSFLDSTARMLASGGSAGVSSAIAGMGAFSQGLQKYSAMGAGPEQAALAAMASAGLEYITEKLPTEQVLKIFHKGGSTSAVKEVLKQAFAVEPLGEEVNLFAGIAAEALILGNKSGKAQRIGDLISGGMTKDEAEKQFWKETFQEAANTYAVSAVAGGLGAGGAAYAGRQVQTSQDQRQEAASPAMPVTRPAEPAATPSAAPAATQTAAPAATSNAAPAAAPETVPMYRPAEPAATQAPVAEQESRTPPVEVKTQTAPANQSDNAATDDPYGVRGLSFEEMFEAYDGDRASAPKKLQNILNGKRGRITDKDIQKIARDRASVAWLKERGLEATSEHIENLRDDKYRIPGIEGIVKDRTAGRSTIGTAPAPSSAAAQSGTGTALFAPENVPASEADSSDALQSAQVEDVQQAMEATAEQFVPAPAAPVVAQKTPADDDWDFEAWLDGAYDTEPAPQQTELAPDQAEDVRQAMEATAAEFSPVPEAPVTEQTTPAVKKDAKTLELEKQIRDAEGEAAKLKEEYDRIHHDVYLENQKNGRSFDYVYYDERVKNADRAVKDSQKQVETLRRALEDHNFAVESGITDATELAIAKQIRDAEQKVNELSKSNRLSDKAKAPEAEKLLNGLRSDLESYKKAREQGKTVKYWSAFDPSAVVETDTAAETPMIPAQQDAPVEDVQQALEDTAAGLQETSTTPVPAAPMTEQQEQLQQAIADLPGMEGRQEMPESETGSQEQVTKAVTNPVESYPAEKQNMIRSYIQAVDTKIKDFVQKVKSGDTTFKRQKIADVNDRAASDIGRILGIDVKGFSHNINTNGVQHIINRHTGKPGGHDNSMELVDDIARVGWVLENYDNVELLVEDGEQVYSSEFRDKNDNPAPQVRFVKKIDGNYYVVEAACENKYNKLWVQSAYLQKNNGDVTQAPAEGPSANHETNARSALASPSPTDIVRENAAEVKEKTSDENATGLKAPATNVNAPAGSPLTKDSKTMPAGGGQPATATQPSVNAEPTAPAETAGPDYRASNTYMNTGLHSENANIRAGYRQELRKNPGAALYEVKHNADTLAEAQSRTGSAEKNTAALDELLNKEHWTPEDVATSTLLLDQIMASGDKDAISRMNDLRRKRKEAGTYFGQGAQSFAIHNPTMARAESPATAVDSFRSRLNGMKQEETTWSPKTGVPFETWKEQIGQEVDRIGIAIASVEDGDSVSMRQIIKQIAQQRQTTAWFGTSENLTNRAWNILKNLEFEDLKKIANTQLVAMADDYRARSKGEIAGGLRKQSMLSSLKTFTRNIAGNTVGSFADAVSESGAGRMMDAVLSKFTGKRTVGNDLFRTGTYVKAAKEAGQFASLCVELNIPIETDVEGSYAAAAGEGGNSKYLGKTFRATGNPAMRALYAYQKYMSYALEVTDKIFEGGSNAAVAESLNRLKNANLTQEEAGTLAEFTANKRTFKNATWEEDGQTKGAVMARKGSKLKGDLGIVGEVAMPYVNVPMNVAQTGIDYTAGVAKGLEEMVSIIKDAKAGKTIPVERQRQAASDFGRGVTGTAMIALFASAAAMGALKASNSEDWDKEALAQAEGRSGAQINWSALLRGMNGEDASWQSGDIISGMDFLEPFNTQMYLGAELAQAEDINLLTYAGSTIKSVWQSLMDSPVMTGLADIEQTLKDVSEAETPADAMNVAAGYAGDVASSFVPQFVRQTAQNQDGYYRDTRGENALDSAINSFLAAIPGQSQKLPLKYSGLGEVQQRGSAVETFLDPTATKEYQQNEVTGFLDELSGRTGDNGIYPARQAPMRITVAGREVAFDGSMRETYQKTYGEAVNDQYRSLMENPDFQGFSDELKTEALKAAEANARKIAMAAVSDYKEAPSGTAAQMAKEIVNQQVRQQISGLFTNYERDREYGYSTEETAGKMDAAYDAFQDLSKQTQREILKQATSDTARYLEVREKGVSTEQYLGAAQRIDGLKPQQGYDTVRDIQKWEAIASQNGMSDSARDALIKAYMPDYDPNDRSPDKTELRYDYARQELGLTPKQYVEVYQVQADGGKKDEKLQEWQDLGYSEEEADMFYRLFAATGSTKIDVVDWNRRK